MGDICRRMHVFRNLETFSYVYIYIYIHVYQELGTIVLVKEWYMQYIYTYV